nr:immunoglobulin heavy chain junction region [Macaca mulatta]MOX15784.1 immunoglobulin heavy chain junction region [Macaca mulatta]MOX16615.1 immunoglobulin heavy chain junction region [Macaca mulatta]
CSTFYYSGSPGVFFDYW